MTKWTFLIAAVLLEVSASLSLKGALVYPSLYLLVGIGYAGAFGGLFMALRHGISLGVGYGIWGAAGVALTAILSTVIYAEPLTLTMGTGIIAIIIGVLLVELGSQKQEPA